jgi:BNR repeat-like domain
MPDQYPMDSNSDRAGLRIFITEGGVAVKERRHHPVQISWKWFWVVFCLLGIRSLGFSAAVKTQASPPEIVHQFHILHEPVLLPDGKLLALAIRFRGAVQVVTGETSSDDGHTWSAPTDLTTLPTQGGVFGYYKALVDHEGEIHIFLLADSYTGAGLQLPGKRPQSTEPVLDIWHLKTRHRRKIWEPAQRIWKGRAGDLLSAIQLASGRILLPICFLTDRRWGDRGAGFDAFRYVGRFETSALYSDDDGATWQQSSSVLEVPTPSLSSEGAIEPVILQLKDGRVWMLIRTQMGRFYASFSQDGTVWTRPEPTSIVSSDSPAGLLRLKDGRIFMLVNDSLRYPYAFGGRQVLLGAISEDEGRSWHGYREVIRDPLRRRPPPKSGDFGVAYPFATQTRDGKVLFTLGVASGTRSQQPEGPKGVSPEEKRSVVLVDPAWLDETSQQTDFSRGLNDWSLFGTRGVGLVPDPEQPGRQVLRLAKPVAGWPSGAVWNFPSGRRGKMTLRLELQAGFRGALIGLTDHFSVPWDEEDRFYNVFNIPLRANGDSGLSKQLQRGRWHELTLDWDCDRKICNLTVDGKQAETIHLHRLPQSQGICYLRMRSTARPTDPQGLLVSSVSVVVSREPSP